MNNSTHTNSDKSTVDQQPAAGAPQVLERPGKVAQTPESQVQRKQIDLARRGSRSAVQLKRQLDLARKGRSQQQLQLKAKLVQAKGKRDNRPLAEQPVILYQDAPKPHGLSFDPSPQGVVQRVYAYIKGQYQSLANMTNTLKVDANGRKVYLYKKHNKYYVVTSSKHGYDVVSLYKGRLYSPHLAPPKKKKNDMSEDEEESDDDDEEENTEYEDDDDDMDDNKVMAANDYDHNDLNDFNSDSDEDFPNIKTAKIKGLKKSDKTFHVSNSANRYPRKSVQQLERDAIYIHNANGGDNRTTIVTSQFMDKSGNHLRVLFTNAKLASPKARIAAEKLGYIAGYFVKTHAEANLLIYAHKHIDDLLYDGHGCDKGACKQCEQLLKMTYGSDNLDFGSKGKTGKFSKTYYNKGFANMTSDQLELLLDNIHKTYGKDGKKKT